MQYLLLPIRILFTIYGLLLFVAFMFLILPLVIIASFFGKVKGGDFIYRLCRLWADVLLPLVGIFHKNIYATPHDRNKQYVFVVNHISYMDIPIILKAVRRQRIRVLGKYETSKIPVFGFIYRNAVVMVDRGSAEKRAKSVRQLKSVIQKKISIILFPEGTFNETHQPLKEFFDGAFRIAIETQTPIKPILFLDTYDRLNYKSFFSLTPGKSRAVYLEEINVEGLTMKDLTTLKNKVHQLMETKLIEYKATWIK
jgi:1-acyl-sn-glycerol-3-phosphate acyltransferase